MPKRSTRKVKSTPAREDPQNGADVAASESSTQPGVVVESEATPTVTNQIVINAFAAGGGRAWAKRTVVAARAHRFVAHAVGVGSRGPLYGAGV